MQMFILRHALLANLHLWRQSALKGLLHGKKTVWRRSLVSRDLGVLLSWRRPPLWTVTKSIKACCRTSTTMP